MLLLLLLLTTSAAADTCAPVRLDKNFDFPVTQQGSTPSCYTHSASLLYSAYAQKSNPESKLKAAPEALWTAILATPKVQQKKLLSATLGRTCEAVNFLNETGACERDGVLQFWKPFVEEENEESFVGSEAEQEGFEPFKEFMSGAYDSSKRRGLYGQCLELSREMSLSGLGRLVDSMMVILPKVKTKEAFLGALLEEACRTKGLKAASLENPPACTNYGFDAPDTAGNQKLWSPAKFKEKIHAALSAEGALPVGIEYCAGVFTKAARAYITNRTFPKNVDYLNSRASSRNLSPACEFHASAVVGRERKADGKCYLLVQNSWGKSCDKYENRKNCEEGKIWLKEDDLARNIFRISEITTPGR